LAANQAAPPWGVQLLDTMENIQATLANVQATLIDVRRDQRNMRRIAFNLSAVGDSSLLSLERINGDVPLPAEFPLNLTAFHALSHAGLTFLLQFYGLPVIAGAGAPARAQNLRALGNFIGVRTA
jgi:hypothetical protein